MAMVTRRLRFYGGCAFVCLLEREDKDGVSEWMAILYAIVLLVWKTEPHFWNQTENRFFFPL